MSIVLYKYFWSTYDQQNVGLWLDGDIKGRCTPYFALLPPSAYCFALLFQIRQGCISHLGAWAQLLYLTVRAFAVPALTKNLSSYTSYGRSPHACVYISLTLWGSSCLCFTFSSELSSVLSEGQRYKVLTVREHEIVFHAVVVDKWLMHR